MNEIQHIAEYGKSKFIKSNKMAMIAPQDIAYSLLRAFEVYREHENEVDRVFRNKQEALEWLEKQR